jgi:gamma-aminobutyric acid receptor subunit beta
MTANITFRAGMLLVTALFSAGLMAASHGLPAADLIGERPDKQGPATEVDITVYLFDVSEISDINKRFSIDMFVNVRWKDPRLALPDSQRFGKNRAIPMNEIWTPRALIVNDRGLAPQLPRVADVDDDGNVNYRQRLSGDLAADLKLRKFPFDDQRLPIDVVSYPYSPDEVIFSSQSEILGVDTFSAEGWDIRIIGADIGEFVVEDLGIVRPRLTFTLHAQRDAQYYLLTMFLPMSLIVFMAWTVFWLQPEIVPSRIAISTASIFSLIAFGFSIRLTLPRVSYMTRADVFVIGCTLLVFLALGVAVIGSRWANSDRMERALRLNASARWTYVALFLLVTATTMLI